MVYEKADEYGELLATDKFNFAYACYEEKAQHLLKVIRILGTGPEGHIMKEKLR